MFQHIDAYAGDPILSLMEEFSKDARQNKVNLSIGLYYNEDNIVPQLQSVQKAYTHLIPDYDKVRVYLPMDGLKSFNQAAQELIFGQASPARQQGRVVTIQTLGGSGALKVGADFLNKYFPHSEIWSVSRRGKTISRSLMALVFKPISTLIMMRTPMP